MTNKKFVRVRVRVGVWVRAWIYTRHTENMELLPLSRNTQNSQFVTELANKTRELSQKEF